MLFLDVLQLYPYNIYTRSPSVDSRVIWMGRCIVPTECPSPCQAVVGLGCVDPPGAQHFPCHFVSSLGCVDSSDAPHLSTLCGAMGMSLHWASTLCLADPWLGHALDWWVESTRHDAFMLQVLDLSPKCVLAHLALFVMQVTHMLVELFTGSLVSQGSLPRCLYKNEVHSSFDNPKFCVSLGQGKVSCAPS